MIPTGSTQGALGLAGFRVDMNSERRKLVEHRWADNSDKRLWVNCSQLLVLG
jgi:hypothetical protein